MHLGNHHVNGGDLFAVLGSGVWAVIDVIREHGPGWGLVPPIMFGIAAIWNARTNARRLARDVARDEAERALAAATAKAAAEAKARADHLWNVPGPAAGCC